ncbi:hypothetical protein E2C01_039256 [Portunus trituberculatus]|uniref:Uncharacterized protein n=1 Tax=Portunus trituberculatus TaxID=210409 RepID=A0A5B7FMH6_PORTR|nr:hypothetical protein [Portunus trituberculatus]
MCCATEYFALTSPRQAQKHWTTTTTTATTSGTPPHHHYAHRHQDIKHNCSTITTDNHHNS